MSNLFAVVGNIYSGSDLGALSGDVDFDSLPYLDGEIDKEVRFCRYHNQRKDVLVITLSLHTIIQSMDMARSLIAAEMRTFAPRNYLKDNPMPKLTFQNSKILQVKIGNNLHDDV